MHPQKQTAEERSKVKPARQRPARVVIDKTAGDRDERPATRVVKTLQPGAPGTVRLLERYGERLVCVRYRQDPGGVARYTTVELIVSEGMVRIRPDPRKKYGVQTWWDEAALIRQIREAGGRWDAEAKLWTIDGASVEQLRLQRRIRRR